MTRVEVGNNESDPGLDKQLCEAIWEGDLDRVKELCLLGADIECFEESGNTPLHLAIERGDYAIVKSLLHLGANIEHRDRGGSWTPLLHSVEVASDAAAQVGGPSDCRIIRLLLDHGADVHQRTFEGFTALGIAREFLNSEAEQILREAGATE